MLVYASMWWKNPQLSALSIALVPSISNKIELKRQQCMRTKNKQQTATTSNKIINDLHKRWNDTNTDSMHFNVCTTLLLGCYCCWFVAVSTIFHSHVVVCLFICFVFYFIFASFYIVLGRNSIDSVVCCRCGCFCFAFSFCLLLDTLLYFCLRMHWIFITSHWQNESWQRHVYENWTSGTITRRRDFLREWIIA